MLEDFLLGTSSKAANYKRVYRHIHQLGPLTKGGLIDHLKLKQTTLVRILDELLQQNLIKISGYEESSGGRPPALYEVNATAGYFFGIDLSRISTKIVLVDLSFQPIDEIFFPMTREHTPSVTIKLIAREMNELLRKNKIDHKILLGIGIGSVGPIDREQKMILDAEGFVADGWKDVPIVEELQRHFPKKILLENGANTAVLGEYYYSDTPEKNMVYCISGLGLRCGVLMDGRLVQQKTGDASAFGRMVIQAMYSSKSENKSRTLSSLISLDTILEESKIRIEKGERSVLKAITDGDLSTCTIEQIFEAIRLEDPLVLDVVKKSAHYYGIGLANIISLLHPEQVILSSRLIYEYPRYFDLVKKTALEFIYPFNNNDVTFGKGKLKENAVSIGASILVFDSFFKDVIL